MHFLKGGSLAACLLIGLVTSANAAAVLQGTSTSLTGINGLSVDGILYNVAFLDGTCSALYGSCDIAHFPFSSADAEDASKAIMAAIAGTYFDDNPGIVGCTRTDQCEILTPIEVLPFSGAPDQVLWWSAGISYESLNFLAIGNFDYTKDTSTQPAFVYAVYSLATAAPVPEPLTVTLFGAGLVGTYAMRRKKKAWIL